MESDDFMLKVDESFAVLSADVMTPYIYVGYRFAVAKRLQEHHLRSQNRDFWSQAALGDLNSVRVV